MNRRRLPAAPRLDVSSALATSGSGCRNCTVGDGADRASNWDICIVCGRSIVMGSHKGFTQLCHQSYSVLGISSLAGQMGSRKLAIKASQVLLFLHFSLDSMIGNTEGNLSNLVSNINRLLHSCCLNKYLHATETNELDARKNTFFYQ